ncbi:LruC domain-containing protein [Vibrio sp. 10N.261.46.E12]|uniref:LruC domain-containing protein n=1 Tax=unclassified Vibrio TaxID=2614977 RepID=UPI0009775589|nr:MULTISPECIES: LruC domain-containing protein [unclassified Vibrio]OMO37055.1 LruC domain-containing protein [Vibrio sp. 10N.261.45.E1]PMJ24153.1 LruC domain-containing protein [Vibrio sp. 10N.286.45.B6]PML94360.1 LruC domain-containing protein [Vibrio sp. 10N.261.49.E11]PMM75699.1 LruC domain-containing protein [Vibrio sp. 10N.261.46.F12]PMM85177.1 LruC domain-containing protein [Vibrio sp. 10N.261.46.E8]
MKYKQVIYLLTAAVSVPTYATSVDLDFSNHIESTNGSSGWAGSTYDGAVMHFLNVGTHDGKIIDAKVSSSVFGDATFVFHAPNYKEGSTQPSGDIGFLYQTNSAGSAGLIYTFEFYDGTDSLSGTFSEPYTLPEFDMIGYDIDGEPVQSEQVRVFKSEGFYSYQLGGASASLTAEESADGTSVLFTGPGTNYSETDTSGAVKFTYKNTSIVTLQFETVTSSSSSFPNPIFSAFDGNWDLTGFTTPIESSDESDFGDAPNSYGTLQASNGAEHAISSTLYLGASIDADSDGQPGASSNGDDLDVGGNDDDGVALLTNLEIGLDSLINVNVVGSGYLQAWADWDMNGSFEDDEQILKNHSVVDGSQVVPIRVGDDAAVGAVQTRFRLASSPNIPSDGYVGDGEVEDYVFNVTDPGTTVQHSNYYTAAFEDNWPEVGDFDLNDVVVYYRTTILSKDDVVLRMDITGTIMAYGASYGNGLGWKLDGFAESDIDLQTARVQKNGATRVNISPFTGEDKSVASPGGDLVVVASLNLKNDLPIHGECMFHRTNPSCSPSLEADQMTFSISLPFASGSEPTVSSLMPLSGFDPFIFGPGEGQYHGDSFATSPGKDLEIHTADFPPTSRGTLVSDFYGIAQDDSDPSSDKYYRTTQNMPWGILISSPWNHPSEYIDISEAYPEFAEWATSGGTSKPTWYQNPNSEKTWSTED